MSIFKLVVLLLAIIFIVIWIRSIIVTAKEKMN